MSEIVKNEKKRKIGYKSPPPSGRPKGSKNKFTRDVKEAFLQAFFDKDGIGGAEGIKKLIKQSTKNKMTFLQMISKMLPSNIDVDHKGMLTLIMSDKFLPKDENGKTEPE